jgi:hypothetical protein
MAESEERRAEQLLEAQNKAEQRNYFGTWDCLKYTLFAA